MALKIDVTSQFGNVCNYHKVTRTIVDWHGKGIQVDVASFVDAQARQDGFEPVMNKSFYWRGEGEFSFDPTENIVANCYTKLKTLPEWLGTEDV
jgi:hypothetical protein